MPVQLELPQRRMPRPLPPERIALNCAFGVGDAITLGDKSRYNSHGAIITATPAVGLHGQCLDFNSANPDYVTIPVAHTQLDFTSENFSLIARVNLDVLAVISGVFWRGIPTTEGWYFYIRGTGDLRVITNQALINQTTISNAGLVVAGVWCTIGFSRAGATVRTYFNGTDQTAAPAVHIDPLTSTQNAYIGADDTPGGWPLDGKIEFLRIFRGIALTPSEHLAWHNALA